MNVIVRSILQVLQGVTRAFQTSPAAIASALAFAIVTMIRIQLDWPQQEAHNLLFNCLHWAFAFGSVFGLAATTLAQSRFGRPRAFLNANLLSVAAVAVTFLLLYTFGGTEPTQAGSHFPVLSRLAASRVGAASLVTLIAFIVLAAYPEDQSDVARSFFMVHKAFFIALVYGLVIEAGTSGVVGAFQALLYRGMSSKVYMYLGTLSGFLAFTIFAGYFPDFRKGRVDPHREVAQTQPRFFEILFGNILVPIVLVLTAVLLVWAGRTMLGGMGSSFMRVTGIATAYTIGGIWLHILVTHHDTGLARFYRRAFPIAALVILAFEAWALSIQLRQSGLKTEEYFFIVVWIVALVSAVLLLVAGARAHKAIAGLVCAMAVFSVLPGAGYHALPVTSQVDRLDKLLAGQGMLQDGRLVPATVEPEPAVRESITDAINYLAYAKDAELPAWFDRRLGESDEFETRLGFEQTWPEPEVVVEGGPKSATGIFMILEPGAVDISDYRWAVNLENGEVKGQERKGSVTIDGDRGSYKISWTWHVQPGRQRLRIELDGRVILDEDMSAYIDRIIATRAPGQAEPSAEAFENMSLQLEAPEVTALLVFRSANINLDPSQDTVNYWLELGTLYLREKP